MYSPGSRSCEGGHHMGRGKAGGTQSVILSVWAGISGGRVAHGLRAGPYASWRSWR